MWTEIEEKLNTLSLFYKKNFKPPSYISLINTKNTIVYLKKNKYPPPSLLNFNGNGSIYFEWDYDILKLTLNIIEKKTEFIIYFDNTEIYKNLWPTV